MILESAQLLSTAVAHCYKNHPMPEFLRMALYKPAYHKHPCTLWTIESSSNRIWLCELAMALQLEREAVANCGTHKSIPLIRAIYEYQLEMNIYAKASNHTPHIFCGPATISHRLNMTTVQRYQEFYRRKAIRWPIDSGIQMTYKGRPIPAFIADLITA